MRFFHQEDLNDCGLACLAMIINHHHKRYITPYQLKKMLPTDMKGGISFYDLISLGRNFNLKGTAYNCELEFLKLQTQFPILLNIKDKNDLNHFVVFASVKNQNPIILDPALKFGHRQLGWDYLEKYYLNQIIIFEKTKSWKPRVNWIYICQYTKKFWFLLFFIVLMTTLGNYFWFLTNFFIRDLEFWAQTNKISHFSVVKLGLYFTGGSVCYLLQLACNNFLRQSLWSIFIHNELQFSNDKPINQFDQNGFWDLINSHFQTINLFFNFITKFFSHLLLLPLIIWIILKNNFWILLVYVLFLIINVLFNNFYLKFFSQTQEELETKKNNYHFKLAFYLSNHIHLKKRQYQKLNLEILNEEQLRYFRVERRHNFWFSLSDLNQQITQRIFSLVFWFLIFLFIFHSSKPINDLLILSLVVQLSMSLSIDLIQNWLLFWHQKYNLHNLRALKKNSKQQLSFETNEQYVSTMIQFQDFSFETPGSFYFIKNSTFKLPLQIVGESTLLNGLYQSCLSSQATLFINSRPIKNYQEQLFAIDHEAVPISTNLIGNLFLGKSINKEFIEIVNLPYWFSKYNLDWNCEIDFLTTKKSQLQIINFLSLIFSDYQLYFLNQPLSEIDKQDQELLWKLLFKLKADRYLIIFGGINLDVDKGIFIEKIQLEDMI